MKKIDWHDPGMIPQVLYFQNGALYTGSVTNSGRKEFRYRLSPSDGNILAEVWYGPFCYEKSEIEDRADFPMDQQGRSDALDWLEAKYTGMIK